MGMGECMSVNLSYLNDIEYFKCISEVITDGKRKIKRFPNFVFYDFVLDSYKGDSSLIAGIHDYDDFIYFQHDIFFQEVKKNSLFTGKMKWMNTDIDFELRFIKLTRRILVFQLKSDNCTAVMTCIPWEKTYHRYGDFLTDE